jgi:hypothetical protein
LNKDGNDEPALHNMQRTVVIQQLLNQIDMCQQHTPATISVQPDFQRARLRRAGKIKI